MKMSHSEVMDAYRLVKAKRGLDELITQVEGCGHDRLILLVLEAAHEGDTIGDCGSSGIPVDILLDSLKAARSAVVARLLDAGVEAA